jgi:phosphatidylinositol kinase/protein kinase (PI-3  family)
VNNIHTIRHSCDDLYNHAQKGLKTAQIKSLKARCDNNQITKLELFSNEILPHFPPILHEWYLLKFPNPMSWYVARNNFSNTCAVWSMLGHIVGLGDRHGENLLLCSETGDLLHVDFACLFDKGETLAVPERVRFRLSQNMIDVMGVTGVEGMFRTASEISLRVLSENKDTLMGILETFIHDPLVEWQSAGSKSERMDSKTLLARVTRRLDGHLDLFGEQAETLPLNVQGQVAKLIRNSSSPETLSRMYIWWMPWL